MLVICNYLGVWDDRTYASSKGPWLASDFTHVYGGKEIPCRIAIVESLERKTHDPPKHSTSLGQTSFRNADSYSIHTTNTLSELLFSH
jgi:hypothetical protein